MVMRQMRFEDENNSLDVLQYFNQCVQDNVIYVRPGTFAMSQRKLDSLIQIAYMQKYYQCNPVRFINDFFNIELLDAQAWIVQQSWTCPNVLLVCSRGFGKSTLIDLIIMAKDMLFNNYYIRLFKCLIKKIMAKLIGSLVGIQNLMLNM